MHSTFKILSVGLGLCVWAAGAGVGRAGSDASALLAAVEEDVWQHELRDELWLQLKYGKEITRLPSLSLSAARANAAFYTAVQERLAGIDEARLRPDERSSLGLLRWFAADRIQAAGYHWFYNPITPYGSFLRVVRPIFAQFRFEQPVDAQRYLDLLERLPVLVEEMHGHVRRQAARGIVLPQAQVDNAVTFLDGLLGDAQSSPFGVDEQRLTALAPARAKAFQIDVAATIAERINPAVQRLVAYVGGAYREQAPAAVGLWQYPGGSDYYRYLVRSRTTLDLPPEEIHRIGLEAVARLEGEMARLRRELGFKGRKAEFDRRLQDDPRLYAQTPEEVRHKLLGYVTGMEAVIGRLFARRPQAPADVQRLAPGLETVMTYGYYRPPNVADPKGIYFFNGSKLSERSLLRAESLIYHELIPGHHFQVVLQDENKELSLLRRNYFNSAYAEGWAEYAASLGLELGRYQDPLDRYGRYASAMFFAARVVVDTGMGHMRWSLERAREYMREHMQLSETEIATESLRYCCDVPGQALAYMMGAREIRLLRARAASALGERFDVRRFHDVVLGGGALPLAVLGQRVEDFIAREGSWAKP